VHDEAADGLQSRSGRIKQTKDKDVVVDDDDDDDDDNDDDDDDDDGDDDVVVVVVTYLFTNILVPT
tara:strand:- start:448 stop:645 length:198 start_codon:yes stop_codon:yes gene_type:complete